VEFSRVGELPHAVCVYLVVKFKRLSPQEGQISRSKLHHSAVPSVRFEPLGVFWSQKIGLALLLFVRVVVELFNGG
jgi:hypothetical protein